MGCRPALPESRLGWARGTPVPREQIQVHTGVHDGIDNWGRRDRGDEGQVSLNSWHPYGHHHLPQVWATPTFKLLLHTPQFFQDGADFLERVEGRVGRAHHPWAFPSFGGSRQESGHSLNQLGKPRPRKLPVSRGPSPHLVGCLQDGHLILSIDPGLQVLPCSARVLEEDPRGGDQNDVLTRELRHDTQTSPLLWEAHTNHSWVKRETETQNRSKTRASLHYGTHLCLTPGLGTTGLGTKTGERRWGLPKYRVCLLGATYTTSCIGAHTGTHQVTCPHLDIRTSKVPVHVHIYICAWGLPTHFIFSVRCSVFSRMACDSWDTGFSIRLSKITCKDPGISMATAAPQEAPSLFIP